MADNTHRHRSTHNTKTCIASLHTLAAEAAVVRKQLASAQETLYDMQQKHFMTHYASQQAVDACEAGDMVTRQVQVENEMKFRLHSVLKLQRGGGDPVIIGRSNHVIAMPVQMEPTIFAQQVLRTLVSLDEPWRRVGGNKGGEAAPESTVSAFRDSVVSVLSAPDFAHNWQAPDKTPIGSDPALQAESRLLHKEFSCNQAASTRVSPAVLSVFYSEFVQPVQTLGLHRMDINDHHLHRGFCECVQAMRHFKVSPRELVMYAQDPSKAVSWGLHVSVTPTTQQHRAALNIARLAVSAVNDQLGDAKRQTGHVLAVSSLGIINDHVNSSSLPLAAVKRLSMQEVACTPHNRFGWHDAQYGNFAVPQLHAYARWIGEIHFMTQVAKAILRTREEITPNTEVAAAVAEQRGAQLRNEGRLCAYWKTVQSLMTQDEDRCLHEFISTLKSKPSLLNVRLTSARAAQTSDAVDCTDSERPKVRTLNRIGATFNVKGACMVPIHSLHRDEKFIEVKINNRFPLEMSTIAYD